jgi:hypothetical protein
MVAMINKNVLPSKLYIPFVGDVNVLSKLLIYNIELILFRGPFSCFENNWHLKEEFKRSSKRAELAEKLSKHIAYYAIVNLVLAPLIFLWQVLFFFFSYAPVNYLNFTFYKIKNYFYKFTDCEEGANLPRDANVVAIWQIILTTFQRTRS